MYQVQGRVPSLLTQPWIATLLQTCAISADTDLSRFDTACNTLPDLQYVIRKTGMIQTGKCVPSREMCRLTSFDLSHDPQSIQLVINNDCVLTRFFGA